MPKSIQAELKEKTNDSEEGTNVTTIQKQTEEKQSKCRPATGSDDFNLAPAAVANCNPWRQPARRVRSYDLPPASFARGGRISG